MYIAFLKSFKENRNIAWTYEIMMFLNSSPPGQNAYHFTDGIFNHIFLNENVLNQI